jgi:hypothetical protein
MFLHVIGQIVDDVGNNIANTTVCAPVNNLAHSLYQQVQVEFNNKPVNSPVVNASKLWNRSKEFTFKELFMG